MARASKSLQQKKAIPLTFDQFRYSFGNAIPAPAKPLFQAAAASLAGSGTKVNTNNATRGPLLITGGQQDHTVPALLSRAAAKKYHAGAITDYKQFAGRHHPTQEA